MPIGIIYSGIILVTISITSIAGISGGVVLRPIFDAIGYHNPLSIAFYMGIAVITMTIASTFKVVSMGATVKINKAMSLAIGSFVGGFLGQLIMDGIVLTVGEDALQIIQNVLSIGSLIFVLACTRDDVRKFAFNKIRWYLLAGLGLGTFSTVLAIGGGPINVVAFVILFGISFKESVVYSITTIFFAQIARVGTIGIEHGFGSFDLGLMWFIIPAAIAAGIIGGRLNMVLSEGAVLNVFKMVVVGTISLNIYNVITMHTYGAYLLGAGAGLSAALAYIVWEFVVKPRRQLAALASIGLASAGHGATPVADVHQPSHSLTATGSIRAVTGSIHCVQPAYSIPAEELVSV